MYVHERIQEFSSGVEGGGPGKTDRKKALTFFSSFFFVRPQLILKRESNDGLLRLFQRKLSLNYKFPIFQGGEGGPTFPGGGVQLFPGMGVQLLIPI